MTEDINKLMTEDINKLMTEDINKSAKILIKRK